MKKIYLIYISLLGLLIGGCASSAFSAGKVDYVRMHKGPAPEIVAKNGKAEIIPAGFIKRRLRLGIPSLKASVIGDRQYFYITEKWFMDVINWTEDFIQAQTPELDLKTTYPLGYEETFAMLASNIANIAVAKKYNLNSSALIGLLVAESQFEWEAIPADNKLRVYVVGLTEKGGIVYDLKTHQKVPFNKFPNYDNIVGIMF